MTGLLSVPDVQVATAPSPLDRNAQIEIVVDRTIIEKVGSIGWTHKIYGMYYNILGCPPPVNNAEYHERDSHSTDNSQGILDTHAVFKGIKRPHVGRGVDKSVYIYIIKPEYCYKFIPDMVCAAQRAPFPENAVFAVYIKLDEDDNTWEVFNWELLKADPSDPLLPENFNDRYDERRW